MPDVPPDSIFMSEETIYLRVWPEYSSSGIWRVTHPRQVHAGGNVEYKDLGLSPGLSLAFKVWQEWHDTTRPPDYDSHERFNEELFNNCGRELTAMLRAELPAVYQVAYSSDVAQDPAFNPPVSGRKR